MLSFTRQPNLTSGAKLNEHTASSPRLNSLDLLALGVVLLFGLIHLPFNLFSDQALYTVGARMIDRGAVLYRDFLDIKQPGIYGFYWLGGKLFGFNEVGVHAFELIYMLGFAYVSLRILRGYFSRRWAASLVPILTVGVYYAVAGDLHLTQIEALVSAPLLIACWAAAKSTTALHPWRYMFLSGIAGGLVIVFKLVLLPIPFVFWMIALGFAVRRRPSPTRIVSALMLPALAGVLLPVLLTCVYFAHKQSLGLLIYNTFAYPAEIVRVMPRPGVGRLYHSTEWFIQSFTPLLAFAFVGAVSALHREFDAVTIGLIGWIAAAWGVIILQGLSWWEYHFMLFFVPVGILATKGLEFLWGYADMMLEGAGWRLVSKLAVSLLFLPMIMAVSWKALELVHHRFAIAREDRALYQACMDPRYREWQSAAEFLSAPERRSGKVFIFGEPVLYLLVEREPALISTTPDGQVMTPRAWSELKAELQQKLPEYLFVQDSSPEYELQSNSPETLRLIQSMYHLVQEDRLGSWYMRNDAQLPFVLGSSNSAELKRWK